MIKKKKTREDVACEIFPKNPYEPKTCLSL